MRATIEELEKINSRLPPDSTMQVGQVEILPFMMFDDKETDRATFMSIEMMNKLVKDLNDGKVAMNSMHQSHSTLPAGRSVAGMLNHNGTDRQVLAKMYAVIQRPDGSPMNDGKDLADRYNTGAVFACSAGVYVGFYKCNICGNDIRDYKNCDHWPGEIYQVDEKPVRCLAEMTGHDIQNGIAMDCGAYELSAVTAGGVRGASILTETFGKFQEGANVIEFKKGAFESKNITEHVAFFPAVGEPKSPQEAHMSLTTEDVKKLMAEEYGPLVQDNARLKLENDQFKLKITDLEKVTGEFTTKLEEAGVAATAAAAQIAEFTTQIEVLTAAKAAGDAARTAFEAIVMAEAVKIGQTYDCAGKELPILLEAYEGFKTEVAKLPAGTQTLETLVVAEATGYTGIPESLFKTK